MEVGLHWGTQSRAWGARAAGLKVIREWALTRRRCRPSPLAGVLRPL